MISPILTIITPTTGNKRVLNAIRSVQDQAVVFPLIQHLIVLDGAFDQERSKKLRELDIPKFISSQTNHSVSTAITSVPFPTGLNNFNGHRIYGAFSYLVNTPFVSWLDEDNTLEPNHFESILNHMNMYSLDWCHSLRNIVDKEGNFICQDRCESLGLIKSVLRDHLIDVSCFVLKTEIAWKLSPLWYRQARAANTVPADRSITQVLLSPEGRAQWKGGSTGLFTLNYTCESRHDSVKPEFFIEGNKAMNIENLEAMVY